jgi:hypothetical protein
MPLHSKVAEDVELDLNPMCVRTHSHEVPRFRIPPAGMLPATALQVVRDELTLDACRPASTGRAARRPPAPACAA